MNNLAEPKPPSQTGADLPADEIGHERSENPSGPASPSVCGGRMQGGLAPPCKEFRAENCGEPSEAHGHVAKKDSRMRDEIGESGEAKRARGRQTDLSMPNVEESQFERIGLQEGDHIRHWEDSRRRRSALKLITMIQSAKSATSSKIPRRVVG